MSFYWFEALKKNMAGGGLRKNANPGHTGMQINRVWEFRAEPGPKMGVRSVVWCRAVGDSLY